MGGLRDFLIKFDKPQPVYFPGDVVSGQLVVNLSEQKKFKKIKVELMGWGNVSWRETRRVNNRTQSYTVSNSEQYLALELNVHEGPDLPAGEHLLPFSLMLPPNIPSSFERSQAAGQGSVRYYVKANIVRDWKWDYKVKEHIMVNGICDLNLLPAAKQEGQCQDLYYDVSEVIEVTQQLTMPLNVIIRNNVLSLW